MKLVDILARDLKVWPDQYYQIYQDSGGNLIGTLSDNDLEDCDSEDLPYDPVTIAWDGNSAVVERSEWQEAVDALYPKLAIAEEWNGEGLPPVGTVCEVRGCMSHYQQWNKVTIFAVRGKTLMFDMDDGRWGQTDSHEFRPLRTPEQIAAEERETELNRMVATVSMLDKSWARKVCAGLYDAGYRKFEIIDEQKS